MLAVGSVQPMCHTRLLATYPMLKYQVHALSFPFQLEIQILDENDNKPNFTDSVRKSRSFSVPETAGIQTRLGQILASDSDFGLNGRITYTLEEESISPGGKFMNNSAVVRTALLKFFFCCFSCRAKTKNTAATFLNVHVGCVHFC